MKKTNKIIMAALSLSFFIAACSEVETGYLSGYIKYENPVLYVQSGTDMSTGKLLPDGSTKPLTVEMLEIRNKETGEIAEDLLTERPIVNWLEPYNYETDSTLAQIEEKLVYVDVPAFAFNTVNGEIRWNANTQFAEAEQYEFDLKISNVRGSDVYPNIGQVQITPFEPVTFVGGTRIQVRSLDPVKTIYNVTEDMELLENGTSEINTVTKISDEASPGVTVILKVIDKNGTPFNPKTGEVLGNWPGFNLPSYEDSSVGTEFTDEATIFHFPVTPFPYYTWYNKNPLMYYHIPEGYLGDLDDNEDYDPINGRYWLNFRTNFDINGPGTWEVIIRFPTVTHI
ncbi:hypothetical protein ACJOV8_000775 [Formosa sp. 3Alg 14/1]|uniref:hypothetical protein n=1 Tax=Formosa sp. 3Alg 14/1 TaxID=3382190 RepID=UPI0039BDD9DB